MEGIFSVIIGAACAGVASEMINSVTHPLETKHLGSFFHRRRRDHPRPQQAFSTRASYFRQGYFRNLFPTIGSTIAGFLAYEYAKVIMDDFVFISDNDGGSE
jgi:hypothetical protein